ncbi:MAG TPA: hypothetical protein VHK65_04710 [Candidatus Dormibacteraeota bacterium]|nr:hypothetical protein [Candidatus Dormibacteraeota bacterium]
MRAHRTITLVGVLSLAAGALSATTGAVPVAAQESLVAQAAHGTLRIHMIPTSDGKTKALPTISGAMAQGIRDAYLEQQQAKAAQRQSSQPSQQEQSANLGISAQTLGCSERTSNRNVRVNQDCTFRRQAEEIIKYNPADPTNLIAGQNDSRIGYNHCGFDYSLNSGKTWGDGLPPFWQKENHPEQQAAGLGDPNMHTILGGPGSDATYDFASDPVVAVDSQGRAFFGCVVISLAANEGDGTPPGVNATGLLVSAAPANAKGSFYNNVPAETRKYVVAEDNNAAIFHDKPFIAADFYKNSPNRDNVYATWTVFKSDPAQCGAPPEASPFGCSPIFGSMSTDHGRTWSTPQEISGAGVGCVGFTGTTFIPSPCNQDQGSDPVVVPDGTGALVVTFNNTNTSSFTNRQLAVRCQPSGSSPAGTAHLNCGAPTVVGLDYQAGEPLCNFGRGPEECIPGPFIRTNDFPRIAVNRDNGHLFVTWQDYRTGEFDIHLSESTDGGTTWTEAGPPVNPDSGKDHYFPAIDTASSPTGSGGEANGEGNHGDGADRVGVSYYRTDRIPNENSPTVFAPGQPGVQQENSDYALAGGQGLNTPYAFTVVSPRFPPPDGNQAGFNGDYSGLTIVNTTAHPIWSDTRNTSPYPLSSQDYQGVVHDEDVFTIAVPVPDGHGQQTGD